MSISLFCEWLSAFGADRAQALHADGVIDAVYALLYPDQDAVKSNRSEWALFSGIPLWAWINCSEDQEADAAAISEIAAAPEVAGILLDIEGEWTKGAKLKTVLEAAAKTGKPCRASLAGFSASHVEYDYRELERQQVTVDWQAYAFSGEGPDPAVAVAELYQSSFVVPGWEYRHRVGSQYGYGRVRVIEQSELAVFDSYLRPGQQDSVFGVLPREWGWTVSDRVLWPRDPEKPPNGFVMGRTAYAKIRVTLDVTRGVQDAHSLAEWTEIAASARIPNARKRGISVYKAENASDEVLKAIAEGAV